MAKKHRKKGTGSVRFRKDIKRWVIDFYDKQHVRKQIVTLCVSQDEAIQELERRRSLMILGLNKSKEENPPVISFQDYAGQWYERRKAEFEAGDLAESTLINYRSILNNHLNPYFGHIPLDQISKSNIKDFVAERKTGKWEKKTLRNVIGVLHQILVEAVDDEVINVSPYPEKQLIGKRKRIKPETEKCLEVNQIPIFLNACPSDYHCLFYTAIFSGLRRGELLGLTWKDIDFGNEQIRVRQSLYKGKIKIPKTETSERSIDIGPTHVEILKKHRKAMIEALLQNGKQLTEDTFVFCQSDGRPIDGDNLYHRIFRPILKRVGLNLTIHALRHTFASILIGAGHNLKYVSDQMGHSNIQTTLNIYAHLLEAEHRGAGKKTEEWIEKELTKNDKRVVISAE